MKQAVTNKVSKKLLDLEELNKVIRILNQQRHQKKNGDGFLLIDLKRAYDSVRHEKIIPNSVQQMHEHGTSASH